MRIVLSPDPLLREVCAPVAPDDASIKRLAKQMVSLMYKNNGVGLAGPQVGVLKRIVVIDVDPDDEDGKRTHAQVLINPRITWHSDEMALLSEACLSIPGCSFDVKRYVSVSAECTNEHGEKVVYEKVEGLLAHCLQHEFDHLDGKTIFENLDPISRIDALRVYREALARGAKPGDVGDQ
jgi:peptide deformylase